MNHRSFERGKNNTQHNINISTTQSTSFTSCLTARFSDFQHGTQQRKLQLATTGMAMSGSASENFDP